MADEQRNGSSLTGQNWIQAPKKKTEPREVRQTAPPAGKQARGFDEEFEIADPQICLTNLDAAIADVLRDFCKKHKITATTFVEGAVLTLLEGDRHGEAHDDVLEAAKSRKKLRLRLQKLRQIRTMQQNLEG